MIKKTRPVSPGNFSKRFAEISALYPPEDVAAYLRTQRRWVRRVTQLQISPIQRLVLIFIGTFMTPSKPFCFASVEYICRHVDCERTTVFRAVELAEKEKFLLVDRKKRGGNVYRIRLPDAH